MSINNDDKQEIKDILKDMGILEQDIDDMLEHIIQKEKLMTFSKKTEKTTKDLYKELKELDSRFVLTIPFNSSEESLTGFIAVTGERESLPVLTLC